MKRSLAAASLAASMVCMAGCGAFSQPDDRGELNASLRGLVDAFQARDLDRIMSRYWQDDGLVVFDVVVPRQYTGAKAYRKDWADLLAAFPGPPRAELVDAAAEASGEMGYTRAIVHYVLTDKDSKPQMDLTARLTDVYRRINGRWLVIHEHASWPVEFPSGKADMQSKP